MTEIQRETILLPLHDPLTQIIPYFAKKINRCNSVIYKKRTIHFEFQWVQNLLCSKEFLPGILQQLLREEHFL